MKPGKASVERAQAIRHVLFGAANPVSEGKATKMKLGEVEEILSILSAVGQAEELGGRYISAG